MLRAAGTNIIIMAVLSSCRKKYEAKCSKIIWIITVSRKYVSSPGYKSLYKTFVRHVFKAFLQRITIARESGFWSAIEALSDQDRQSLAATILQRNISLPDYHESKAGHREKQTAEPEAKLSGLPAT